MDEEADAIVGINDAVLKHVAPDDPNRCQTVHANQQCPFRALGSFNLYTQKWDGSAFCPRHAASSHLESRGLGIQQKRGYLLQRFNQRFNDHADSPKIKNLGEELAILRMTLENKINQCVDAVDLEMRSGSIVQTAESIGRVATMFQRIQRENGDLLDKTQAMSWMQQVLGIIADNIGSLPQGQEILQRISEAILETVAAVYPERHDE